MNRSDRYLRRHLALLLVAVLALVGTSCGSGDDGDSVATEGSGQALPRFDPRSADEARGMLAPEVSGASLTGDQVTIGAPGEAQVLVFLAHWCPHCQAEVPRIVDHVASNPLPEDVQVYGVATATASNRPNHPPSEWLEREEWTFPTLDDASDSAQVLYGLSAFPFFVAIDAEGVVVARGSGEPSTAEFDQLVEAARTGEL